MKKIILLSCLLPLISFAGNGKQDTVLATYQELCAKEQDPVKRHNYCYLLEKNTPANHTIFNVFRKDVAVV